MEPLLTARGMTRRFGATVAVDNASFDIARGELFALLGPSGCGKTTLLRLIGGLETPDAGELRVAGRELNGPTTFVPPEKRNVVMVFQDFALFPHMTVAKNVGFAVPRGTGKGRVDGLLELVGLRGLGKRMPHELSGGQQQRVALARALAAEPGLILLDEPFSNLDPAIRQRVRTEVRELLHEVGMTAIFVTHDQDEALSLADRVAVMIHGRILQVGSPREVYTEPGSREVAEFIGQPNFLQGEAIGGWATCALGRFHVAVPDGPCDVMVRAEHIALSETKGVPAKVIENEYFGREVMARVQLRTGEIVRARWAAESAPEPGRCVSIEAAGPVAAFERRP